LSSIDLLLVAPAGGRSVAIQPSSPGSGADRVSGEAWPQVGQDSPSPARFGRHVVPPHQGQLTTVAPGNAASASQTPGGRVSPLSDSRFLASGFPIGV